MKNRILVFPFLILISLSTVCKSQGWIHLDGKQFIDEDGHPFYPMVMNYFVDFTYTGSAPAPDFSNCYIAQTSLYGALGPFDYQNVADGPDRILQDFNEMKNLGFNTVRLVMTPKKKVGQGFYLDIKEWPLASGDTYFHPSINPPYTVQPNSALEFYFSSLLQVINLASIADLKVIEICADAGKPSLGGGELIEGNVGDVNIEDYYNFLLALRSFIQSNNVHNLLAFEFNGEPTLAEGQLAQPHSKSQICEIANYWNGAIKQSSPLYLTTMGSFYLADPFEGGWDPNFLNLDFVNLHLYLNPAEYEYNLDPSTDAYLQKETNRYLDKYYVFCKSCTKPFIIGETGFPGENPTYQLPDLRYPISTYGDEIDQRNFVERTFPIIRNFGSSGYAWWDFQNKHWYGPPSPPVETLKRYQEQYLGLLRYGNPNPLDMANGYSTLRKLAANKFIDYKNNPPAMPSPLDFGPQSPITNSNEHFYDPYDHSENFDVYPQFSSTPSYFGTIKGKITDQDGNPIPRTILNGTSIVGLDLQGKNIFYGYYTFTDESGDYEIRGYDYLPSNSAVPSEPNQIKDKMILDLKLAAFKSNSIKIGWNGNGTIPWSSQMDLNLKSLQNEFDKVLDNVIIPIGITENYEGKSTLTLKNYIVEGNFSQGGTSELKATTDVVLKSGFNAVAGSEVHVFTEPINYVICSETNFLVYERRKPGEINIEEQNVNFNEREIDVNFYDKKGNVKTLISPNPNQGNFTIQFEGYEDELVEKNIILYDCLGNQVMKAKINKKQLNVSLQNAKPGLYYLCTSSSENNSVNKIIVF